MVNRSRKDNVQLTLWASMLVTHRQVKHCPASLQCQILEACRRPTSRIHPCRDSRRRDSRRRLCLLNFRPTRRGIRSSTVRDQLQRQYRQTLASDLVVILVWTRRNLRSSNILLRCLNQVTREPEAWPTAVPSRQAQVDFHRCHHIMLLLRADIPV